MTIASEIICRGNLFLTPSTAARLSVSWNVDIFANQWYTGVRKSETQHSHAEFSANTGRVNDGINF